MNSADPTTPRSVSKAFGVSACPLDPWNPELQSPARNVIRKGSVSWLKNTEVRDLLLHHSRYKVPVAREPPCKPAGEALGCQIGSLTLPGLSTTFGCFDRRVDLPVRSKGSPLFSKGRSQLEKEGGRQDRSRNPREAQGMECLLKLQATGK